MFQTMRPIRQRWWTAI